MKLRRGKEIGENREQMLEAKNKESYSKLVSLKIKEVTMSTLRELAAPNLEVQPLSIIFDTLDKPVELNSGFINLLPKFHGLASENPYHHVSEFLIACSAMVPEKIPKDQIRLRAFPFSLLGNAKD